MTANGEHENPTTRARSRPIHLTAYSLLAIHAALVAYMATRLSPVNDELAHLAAGLSHWQFDRFDLYKVNPPLVRTLAALPVLLADPQTDWSLYRVSPGRRPQWAIGRQFADANGQRTFHLFTLARWAVLPFTLLGGWACWRWARELWGDAGGLTALTLWCFCPNILGNASFITPDCAAAATGVLGGYALWLWLRDPAWDRAFLAGAALGLMQLVKITWVIAFPLWPALWLIDRLLARRSAPAAPPRPPVRRQLAQLAAILLLGLLVLNAGYGFEGTFTPLGEFRLVSQTFAGPHEPDTLDGIGANRFADTALASLPMPVPKNWLIGIDVQRRDFEREHWSFLAGEWRQGGWWYFYLYALAVKLPLGLWLLVGLALLAAITRSASIPWRAAPVVLLPALVVFALVSAETSMNHHFRYVLPSFGFAFVAVAGSIRFLGPGRWCRTRAAIFAAALLAFVAESLAVYPHSAAFINIAAGGPLNGHRHLSNSCLDWGQGLLELRRWIDAHPHAQPLHVLYGGYVDPNIAGIDAPLPPMDPQPGWHAVSIGALHRHESPYAWLNQFEPVDHAGYVFRIYHITPASIEWPDD